MIMHPTVGLEVIALLFNMLQKALMTETISSEVKGTLNYTKVKKYIYI